MRRCTRRLCCTPSSRITQFSSATSRSTYGVRPRRAKTLDVSLAGQTVSVQANELGRWHATLPALAAGGPHELSVRTQSGQVADCRRCTDRRRVAVRRAVEHGPASASLAGLARRDRELGERQDSHADGAGRQQRRVLSKQFSQAAPWRVAGPSTCRDFSAACFYFARELQKTVDVPMGLIVAAWGGSRIQTWMSEAALRAAGVNNDALDVLALYAERPAAAHARWGAMWEAWWLHRTHERREAAPWAFKPAGEWRRAPLELGPWERWGVPELASVQRHGVVSHERDVVRAAGAAVGDAVVGLGRRDGSDVDQRPADRRSAGEDADRFRAGHRAGSRAQLSIAARHAAAGQERHRRQRARHLCDRRSGRPGASSGQYAWPTARPCRSTTNGNTRSRPRTSARRRVRRGIRCEAWVRSTTA